MVTRCEIHDDPPADGEPGGPVSFGECPACAAALRAGHDEVEAIHRAALVDIQRTLHSLRERGWPGARTAHDEALHRPFLHPHGRRVESALSIRYWPVGRFNWSESRPGGYGEHELIPLGVRAAETVVTQLGRITREVDREIVEGGAPLARLESEPTVVPVIAKNLRTFLG